MIKGTSIITTIKKWFDPSFEDDSVVFKIKVRKGNQEYGSICWYRVYGFWKFRGSFFWKPVGLLKEVHTGGKWSDTLCPMYLDMVEERFVSGDSEVGRYKRTVPVRKLLERMD